MKIKSIRLTTDEVRATLDGRETVTRRVVKPQPVYSEKSGFNWKGRAFGTDLPPTVNGAAYNFRCAAPYRPGDILYVRETWSQTEDGGFLYRAWPGKGQEPEKPDEAMRGFGLKWRPPIHMPREAARIFLRVTDVRVERLQEMSMDDIRRGGAVPSCVMCYYGNLLKDRIACERGIVKAVDCPIESAYPEVGFQALWDSTIKPADRERCGWEANPWVWVIRFERCEKPEEG